MSEHNIIQAIETELKTIATAKENLRRYREQLASLYAKLNAELGEGVSIKHESVIEQPMKEEVLGALKPKEGISMIELSKRLGKRYGSAQLRKVLTELEAGGKVSKKGQKRSTPYTLKA
jgi:predicted transcriptional regulator